MSGRYITLKWGGKEFGSFEVEDFSSERLAQALIGMVDFHIEWIEKVDGPLENKHDYYSASETGFRPSGTPLVAGVVVHRPTGDKVSIFEVLKHSESAKEYLEFCSKYLPPNLASGQRKITAADIDAAVEQLRQEDEADRARSCSAGK